MIFTDEDILHFWTNGNTFDSTPYLITHGSNYHADDVMAAALLQHFWHYHYQEDLIIVRTFDPHSLVEQLLTFDRKDFGIPSIFVADIGAKISDSLNPTHKDILAEQVVYADHHQDINLPCAAVLIQRFVKLASEYVDHKQPVNYTEFYNSLTKELQVLSEWDTQGVPLAPDSVYAQVYLFALDSIPENNTYQFVHAVNYLYTYLARKTDSYKRKHELRAILNDDELVHVEEFNNKHDKPAWKLGQYLGRYVLPWQEKFSFFVVPDLRRDNYLKIIRHDKLKMIVDFNSIHAFKDLEGFKHASGFLMTFEADKFQYVVDALRKHLSHYDTI